MKALNKFIVVFMYIIINIVYSFIGWILFIVWDLTNPSSQKFDAMPYIRIILLIVLILHIIGEVVYFIISYKKIFENRKLYFVLFILLNLNIYIFPMWIGIIESMIP